MIIDMAAGRRELVKLKNIGETSVEKLLDIGISSREQIEELGAVAVYKRLRERYPVSMTMLWALQGALLDLPYYQIPREIRDALIEELSNEEV